jgi:biotin operon repressor
MRRADRLFRIVQFLRRGRLLTAQKLAEKLQVSQRTIYRDVRDLQLNGMPIEGEAGVGYTLRHDLDLPPLSFTASELTALVLGARLVRAWGGAESVDAAAQALLRIEAVLPVEMRERLDTILLYAPGLRMRRDLRERLDVVHAAAGDQLRLRTRGRRAQPARGTAAGALFLWRSVDAGGVVRDARGLPHLPAGPHGGGRGAGANVCAAPRAAAGGLFAEGDRQGAVYRGGHVRGGAQRAGAKIRW